VKAILIISGATTIPGLAAASIAEAAQKLAVFEQVIDNLKEIKKVLSQLSKRFGMIDGMQGELRMDDRDEFLQLLKHTQIEVDRGFEILAQF
jgi:hypothetical protein